jgi:hypothetical protein
MEPGKRGRAVSFSMANMQIHQRSSVAPLESLGSLKSPPRSLSFCSPLHHRSISNISSGTVWLYNPRFRKLHRGLFMVKPLCGFINLTKVTPLSPSPSVLVSLNPKFHRASEQLQNIGKFGWFSTNNILRQRLRATTG